MKACVLVFCLLMVAIAKAKQPKAEWTCSMEKGKKIRNIAKQKFSMTIPCKWKALSKQTCGSYTISLTAGNVLDYKAVTFLNTLFIKVVHTSTGRIFVGSTNIRLAQKYLDGSPKQTQPLNTLPHGSVGYNFCNIFNATKNADENQFTVTEKEGEFSLTYSLIDEDKKKRELSSGFKFACFRKETAFKAYPTQFCGNQDKNVMNKHWVDLKFNGENKDLGVIHDVLAAENVAQSNARNKTTAWESEGLFNSSCKRVSNTYKNQCKDLTIQRNALATCSGILTDKKLVKCIAKDTSTPPPIDIFWNCMAYVCSNYKATHHCGHLVHALDQCPKLTRGDGLTQKLESKCRYYKE